ncbi:MAG: bacillithiol system redox-active protein YtxJ [Vicingaceae bacterium]
MQWNNLTSIEQIEEIINLSNSDSIKAVAVFKHSTRCIISSMAKNRMQRKWKFDVKDIPLYYLDILNHRDVSNEIARRLNITHESPQLLLIKNGKCIINQTHNAVEPGDIDI